MKSNFSTVLVLLLLPVLTMGQVFKSPEFSSQKDFATLARSIERHSPLLQRLYAGSAIRADMKPEEARALIHEKLKELNNEGLTKTYAKLDNEQVTRVGVILYLLMNGLSNTDDYPGVDYKMALGGGLGVYLMWTLANFVLMPELAYIIRPLKQTYDDEDDFRERYSYITLAFTAMYMIKMATMNILLGLSPNFGYALGGKFKEGDDDWEDIEFDDDGVKRSNFGLGITAGVMLRNAMIIRLMYNLGISKMYEGADYKMYAIALSLQIPIWALK